MYTWLYFWSADLSEPEIYVSFIFMKSKYENRNEYTFSNANHYLKLDLRETPVPQDRCKSGWLSWNPSKVVGPIRRLWTLRRYMHTPPFLNVRISTALTRLIFTTLYKFFTGSNIVYSERTLWFLYSLSEQKVEVKMKTYMWVFLFSFMCVWDIYCLNISYLNNSLFLQTWFQSFCVWNLFISSFLGRWFVVMLL